MKAGHSILRWTLVLVLIGLGLPIWGQCSGTERWPVKVGTDPDAGMVDVAHPVPKTLVDLIG